MKKLSVTVTGALLSVVAISAVAASTIRTRSAVYGDPDTHNVCNATAAVASICNGQSQCIVPVENNLCGDPAYLVVKKIRVDYRCGRHRRSAIGNEYTAISLACH